LTSSETENQDLLVDLIFSALRLEDYNDLKSQVLKVKENLQVRWEVKKPLVQSMTAKINNCVISELTGFKIETVSECCNLAADCLINYLSGNKNAQDKFLDLFKSYVNAQQPGKWKSLFKDADNIAKFLKYAMRETFDEAFTSIKKKNSGDNSALLQDLLDQTKNVLTGPIFTPNDIDKILKDSGANSFDDAIAQLNNRMDQQTTPEGKLLFELSIAWIRHFNDNSIVKIPVPPRNIQLINVLNMCHWVKEVYRGNNYSSPSRTLGGAGNKSLITQVSTGEGKRSEFYFKQNFCIIF